MHHLKPTAHGGVPHAPPPKKNVVPGNCTNPNILRIPNFCVGCSKLYLGKNFAAAPKTGKNDLILPFLLRNSVLQSCFRLTESKSISIFAFFFGVWASLLGGGYGSFSLVPLKRTWGILTLGLQFILTQAYKCGSVGLWDCSPDKKKQSKREAMEAMKKRDAPCSMSVFKSEGRAGATTIFVSNFFCRCQFCKGRAAED